MIDIQSAVKERERGFHDQRYGSEVDPRSQLEKYYSITHESQEVFRKLVTGSLTENSRLLEYGCGMGESADFHSTLNCEFYGIDISPEAIKKADETARQLGFNATYLVADAENTALEEDSFDVIIGSGILHHLNLDNALAELSRITKKSGYCVFTEPLGYNPFINLFRRLTPKLRSSDEHPLMTDDFQKMEQYFGKVDVFYFHFFSFVAVMFLKTPFFERVRRRMAMLDDYLVRNMSWFGKYCWICVVRLSDPLKT
jgi:SAM-dependent methyltransferase